MHETFNLNIEFDFGLIDGRYMIVEAMYNNQTYISYPDNKTLQIKNITLPTQIILKFSGKNLDKDTKIDKSGNIIEDKYVKIKSIKLDHLNIPDWIIQKKFSYITENNQIIKTSYIGFNGVMTIDIPEKNIFSYYRRLNKDE